MAKLFPAKERFKVSQDAPRMGIGIPVRKGGVKCPEFWMNVFQLMAPLNVKSAYIVEKGILPAQARNNILETAMEWGTKYLLFLDDDVLFPDVTAIRLWNQMKLHPEAAAITGIYTTKHSPPEPLLYADMGSGAFWDWPLGALIPIHSAGAGCMIVDVERISKLSPPWFQDAYESQQAKDGVHNTSTLGHDRYFLSRLNEETDGKVYADTALLLGHMDVDSDAIYIMPPESPCYDFKRFVPDGEAYLPYIDAQGCIIWRRIIPIKDTPFASYVEWLAANQEQAVRQEMIKTDAKPQLIEPIAPRRRREKK